MIDRSIKLTTKYWLIKQFLHDYDYDYDINNIIGGKAKKQWTTLSHNGVLFPPEYIPHLIPLIYLGKEITLDPLAEEYATFYAKFIDTEYISRIFNKNFWNDWKPTLK